jgi:hypothetical protein
VRLPLPQLENKMAIEVDVIVRVSVNASTYEEAVPYAQEIIAESLEWINEENARIYGRYVTDVTDVISIEAKHGLEINSNNQS